MSSDDRESARLLIKQVEQLQELTAEVAELRNSLKMARLSTADWQKQCKALQVRVQELERESHGGPSNH